MAIKSGFIMLTKFFYNPNKLLATKTEKYISETGTEITVHFDDLQFQQIDHVDHSIIYECRGYDANGNEYTGIATFTCGELDSIEDIEQL